jgi:hypothetical protein
MRVLSVAALSVLVLSLLGRSPAPAWADNELALAPPLVDAADRAAIANYYRGEHRAGHCPAGLVRSKLGCERKPLWTLGAPLDPSVAVEPLPAPLLARLSPAPEGCRYVRVGDRVLLIEAKSRVVQGELLDLGQVGIGRIAPRLRLSAGSDASR